MPRRTPSRASIKTLADIAQLHTIQNVRSRSIETLVRSVAVAKGIAEADWRAQLLEDVRSRLAYPNASSDIELGGCAVAKMKHPRDTAANTGTAALQWDREHRMFEFWKESAV